LTPGPGALEAGGVKPKRHSLVLATALAAAALAYLPALRGEFQFDDWSSIQTNWAIRDPGRFVTELSPLDLLGPGRPVTDATFALNYAVGELEPLQYHLSSLALHLGTALLAFLLIRGALRRAGHPRADPLATIAAAAFALHPLQTESVCYAAQRAEVLSAALFLGALLLLVRAYDAWPRRGAFGWAAAATGTAALALGAKTVAVTLPAAFLLWAAAFGRREGDVTSLPGRVARALVLGAGAWALAIGSIARNLLLLGPGQTAGLHAGDLGPWRYLLTQLRVHWWYARLLAWPAGQSIDPAFPPSSALPDAETWAAAIGTVALLGIAGWLAWRAERDGAPSPARRAIAFGVGWWYLLLAPTSSVVPIADVAAEHRVYLALLGGVLAVAAAADALAASRRAHAVAAVGAAAACVALTIAVASRAKVWKTELSLWQDAAEKHPDSYRALDDYAYALSKVADRRDEALRTFARAQSLARTRRQLANTARNYANLYLSAGQPEAALNVIDIGIAAESHDWELRATRASALRPLARLDEAHAEATRAVSLAPGEPLAHDMLGVVLLDRGEPERALAEFRVARETDPADPLYAEHAFLALARLGRRTDACASWAVAARGRPGALLHSTAAGLGCAP